MFFLGKFANNFWMALNSMRLQLMEWHVFRRMLVRNLLLTLTICSVFVGLLLGFILRPLSLSDQTCLLINFPGEIFMQVLKMMILPLIFSSLISALAQMDASESGQMGLATVTYYGVTAVLSTIVGIVLVLSIHPGDPTVKSDWLDDSPQDADVSPLDTFLDMIRNMFPENMIQASFQRVQTSYTLVKPTFKKISKNTTVEMIPKIVKTIESARGTNILGMIVFCTGFGIVISKLGDRARIIVDFFVILDAVIMRWVEALMWFAPLGIVCLITASLLELEDLSDTAQVLFMYVITVIAGLLLHTIVVMPALYFFITRKNPLTIAQRMLHALVTAFGTGSSGAALPVSMQCLEEKLKVDRRVTRFVLPLGTTINMDGNALYEAVAVIFIAQLNNVSLSIAEVITVSLTATIASIGMGSVPAGLVSILLILNTIGLPTKDVPLLITVDWLIDRIRTSVNVLGDGYVAAAVAHILKDRLDKSNHTNEFRAAVKEEIELLKSATTSRCSSMNWNDVASQSVSPNPSRLNSMTVFGGGRLSWRKASNAAFFKPKVSLSRVLNV